MTRTVHGFWLVLFSIVLVGCSLVSPSKPADAGAGAGTATASPVPAPVSTPVSAPVAVSTPMPAAASGPVLQSQDANQAGVVVDFTECKRKDGVLSVKLRFRNVSSKQADFAVIDNFNYTSFYVTAANKKYFILKDSEGTYLAPAGQYQWAKLAPGEQYMWWAKYPAPPPDVKKITFIMPVSTPFEDVPITDQ